MSDVLDDMSKHLGDTEAIKRPFTKTSFNTIASYSWFKNYIKNHSTESKHDEKKED